MPHLPLVMVLCHAGPAKKKPILPIQVELGQQARRATTVTELSDMASAAIIGPNLPKRPSAARGIPSGL